MAYTQYMGRHRVTTVRTSNSCFAVELKQPSGPGAQYPRKIGTVCMRDGVWKYSYVGGGAYSTEPIYGGSKTKLAAVKNVVKSYRSWMSDTTEMGSSRRRRRAR